jgi:hypothetical protein
MVRDARDVCEARVRRAGREEQCGGEPQRCWRTLARAYRHRVVYSQSFFTF